MGENKNWVIEKMTQRRDMREPKFRKSEFK